LYYKLMKKLGYDQFAVLGHPEYYPKFGFKKASEWNIKAPFEVPEEVFMVMELTENALEGVKGVVQYSSAFAE
ncbi:GNAT family N-acetyltransferase, partial [Bacillus sp. B-TM1]